MTVRVKFLSAALIAAAALATPAMARERHVIRHVPADAVAMSRVPYGTPYTPYLEGRGCVPAPRVGAFATQPWDGAPPCEPFSVY
jgi:hypothetical protein